jgi:hypothetical protein
MSLILILVVLFLLFGGGFWGYSNYSGGGGGGFGGSPIMIIVVVLVVLMLFGGPGASRALLLMTDYQNLLEDLLGAGLKATLSTARYLATQAFHGETLPSPQAEIVAAWEARTLAIPFAAVCGKHALDSHDKHALNTLHKSQDDIPSQSD